MIWLDSLIKWLKGPAPTTPVQVTPVATPEPLKPTVHTIGLRDAVKIALDLSASFEGPGKFGNIVGNFDGQGLTCGALGWIWKNGNQQAMVLECEKKYPGIVLRLMPSLGATYLKLCRTPVAQSFQQVSSWSDHGQVMPVYKKELQLFWSSPQMVEVQVDHAMRIANEAIKGLDAYCGGDEWPLQEFLFFFDIEVQNGSLAGINLDDVVKFIDGSGGYHEAASKVLQWVLARCPLVNYNTWKEEIEQGGAGHDKIELFVLAHLRSLKAREQYQDEVMNRKATIALLRGYVNREMYDLRQKVPSIEKTWVSLSQKLA